VGEECLLGSLLGMSNVWAGRVGGDFTLSVVVLGWVDIAEVFSLQTCVNDG
jgi:hypothetical protein